MARTTHEVPQIEPQRIEDSLQPAIDSVLLTPDFRKESFPRHTTAQSGSIVIINDTGIGPATMSGALQSRWSLQREWETEPLPTHDLQQYNPGLGINGQAHSPANAPTQRSSGALGLAAEPLSAGYEYITQDEVATAEQDVPFETKERASPRTKQTTSTAGSSATLRHRNSVQSSPTADQAKPSSDATATTISADDADDEEEEADSTPPARGLRRRPGGDLRKAENVHELDHATHHESLESTTTGVGSPIHSFLMMKDTPTKQTTHRTKTQGKKVS